MANLEYDGITQIAADRIVFGGRIYTAGHGDIGATRVSGNHLHGTERRSAAVGETWITADEHGNKSVLCPSYGCRWPGTAFIPTPQTAREKWNAATR